MNQPLGAAACNGIEHIAKTTKILSVLLNVGRRFFDIACLQLMRGQDISMAAQ
jgi:hypothetical protein